MAGRPLAKPAETTPVVTAEEQTKIDADKAAEAAAAAAAEKADAASDATKPTDSKSQAKPATTKAPKEPKYRFEEFDATKPDGTVVRVRRNIDTGEQSVTEK